MKMTISKKKKNGKRKKNFNMLMDTLGRKPWNN